MRTSVASAFGLGLKREEGETREMPEKERARRKSEKERRKRIQEKDYISERQLHGTHTGIKYISFQGMEAWAYLTHSVEEKGRDLRMYDIN